MNLTRLCNILYYGMAWSCWLMFSSSCNVFHYQVWRRNRVYCTVTHWSWDLFRVNDANHLSWQMQCLFDKAGGTKIDGQLPTGCEHILDCWPLWFIRMHQERNARCFPGVTALSLTPDRFELGWWPLPMSKVNVQTHEDGAEILSAGPKEPLEPGSCSYLLLAHGFFRKAPACPCRFCVPGASGSTHRASGPGRMLLTCHLHFPDLAWHNQICQARCIQASKNDIFAWFCFTSC